AFSWEPTRGARCPARHPFTCDGITCAGRVLALQARRGLLKNGRSRDRQGCLVGAADAEADRVGAGAGGGSGRENGERSASDGGIVRGALERGINRAVPLHQLDGVLQIAVGNLAVAQRPLPKGALAIAPTAKAQDDGQRDLAFAEVVTDRLAKAR